MRQAQVVLIFLLFNIFSCDYKEKTNPPFTGNELLAVADGGSLKDFAKLIRKANLHITDSSWGKLSGIEFVGYSAKDSLRSANILEVHIDKDSTVFFMLFETDSKKYFLSLEEDFINLGFKVRKEGYGIKGFRKENSPIDIMMKGFEENSKTFKIFFDSASNIDASEKQFQETQ